MTTRVRDALTAAIGAIDDFDGDGDAIVDAQLDEQNLAEFAVSFDEGDSYVVTIQAQEVSS